MVEKKHDVLLMLTHIAEAVINPRTDEQKADIPIMEFEGMERLGGVYSNFDHQLNEDIALRLQSGGCYAAHFAWEFHGNIWFVDGRWYEEVKRYRAVIARLEGDTIMDVINQACEKFGRE